MPFLIHEAVDSLGYSPYFHQQFLELVAASPEWAGLLPERVTSERRGQYLLAGAHGTRRAVRSGRLSADTYRGPRACVGDFVLASGDAQLARIEHVFERSSVFRRKAVGAATDAQAVAANVDLALIVCALAPEPSDERALERGLSARRLERYLCAASEAPASALLLVNKADLRADGAEQLARLRAELAVEALLVSAASGLGVAELLERIGPGTTAVVVGSSGVGKSSLVNRLLGAEQQRTSEIREDDTRGRHTTTGRELFVLPGGGLLIDTPGMRELGLFADADTDLTRTGFQDIDRYATACQFRDCRHQAEPGCAVRAAVSAGQIGAERLAHAHKLRREMAWQQQRHALQQRRIEKRSSRRARGKDGPPGDD